MSKFKKNCLLVSIVFVLQFVIQNLLTGTTYAAVSYPISFFNVESRPVKEVIRYKNKTISLDHYVNYFDQVVDQPIKLIVDADGKKNIVSEDVQLLRGFKFIGIQDDFAFFVDDYNIGNYIYKVNLNNYTIQKTDESVESYSKNVNVSVKEAVIDNASNKWFSDQTPYWDFRDANGNLIENAGAYLVYNSLGKIVPYKISSRVIDNYEGVGHITPGNDSDVWFTYSYIKDSTLNTRDNKIIRVTKDGTLKEYPIDTNCYIDDIKVDKAGNIYLKATSWAKEGYQMVKKDGMVMHYTFTNGTLQHLQDYPLQSASFKDMDMDENGNVWALDGNKTLKLENGQFNLKFNTPYKMNELKVYDDNNLVAFCFDYGYTNITVQDSNDQTSTTQPPSSSESGTGDNTTNNDNTESNGSLTDGQQLASDILTSDKISKNTVNELSPLVNNNSVEVKLSAENIKGGQGSVKINTDNLTLELPFGTIDFTGSEPGSYVSIKENIITNDSILSNINAIGKVFNFSLATYKSDGTLIRDIHNFVNGRARISIKLTDVDIKNFDTSKLAAFYYNEATKKWELVGGTFNKDTMTFTFDTSHFTKYTIAQVNEVLPQTGSFVNMVNMMVLSAILISIGAFLLFKKEVNR